MAKDYIPRSNSAFNNFQQIMVKAVVANVSDWGIVAGDAAELSDASVKYGNRYKIISNKQGCTTAQRTAHNTFRKVYEKQIRNFVNRHLRDNNSISHSQLLGMGIKVKGKKRGSRSAITDSINLHLVASDGCRVKFYCRQPHHDGAASLHPEADAVEIRYALENKPVSWKDCPHVMTSKKAHVFLELDQAMLAKNIYAYARWVNLSNDKLSGPYSTMAWVMVH